MTDTLAVPADATADRGRDCAAGSPRVERSKTAILAATVDLLVEHGVSGLTIDAVAARARVGKATVYRHWDGRNPLIVDAITSIIDDDDPVDTGTLRGDLLACYDRMLGACSRAPMSSILPSMVAASERDPELETLFRSFKARRRQPTRAAFERAVARGDVPADLDVDLACDLLAGPVFYRRLLLLERPDQAYVNRLLELVLRGVGAVAGRPPLPSLLPSPLPLPLPS